jgi:stage IV sporulation protein FB
MGAISAAAVHEIYHLLALYISGVPVFSVTLGKFGAKIETGVLSTKQELFCALAGPLGSFTMLLLCRQFPEGALWGLLQGTFNLLPVYPMDGGRVLRCLLPEKCCGIIENMVILLLFLLCAYGGWRLKLGIEASFPVFALAMSWCRRKIPCKATEKAVQ